MSCASGLEVPTVAAVMIKGPAHGVWGTHLAGTQSGIQVGGSRFVSGSFLLVVCSESAQLLLLGARPCRGAAWPHPVPGLLTAGCFFLHVPSGTRFPQSLLFSPYI